MTLLGTEQRDGRVIDSMKTTDEMCASVQQLAIEITRTTSLAVNVDYAGYVDGLYVTVQAGKEPRAELIMREQVYLDYPDAGIKLNDLLTGLQSIKQKYTQGAA